MAQYRVLAKSFINDRIVEEGDIVDYDGETSDNLEPVKGKAKKADPATDPAPDSGTDPLV